MRYVTFCFLAVTVVLHYISISMYPVHWGWNQPNRFTSLCITEGQSMIDETSHKQILRPSFSADTKNLFSVYFVTRISNTDFPFTMFTMAYWKIIFSGLYEPTQQKYCALAISSSSFLLRKLCWILKSTWICEFEAWQHQRLPPIFATIPSTYQWHWQSYTRHPLCPLSSLRLYTRSQNFN